MDDSLVRFLKRPVMIVVGTADRERRPEVGRAVGVTVAAADKLLELVISEWQWPKTISNIRATGRAAATFSRPSDYETYQIKGIASVHDKTEDNLAVARAYCRDALSALMEIGLDSSLAEHFLIQRDLVAISLRADDIFVQTPGPRAGSRVRGKA